MKTNLSRRDFLVRSSAAAFAAGLWPGRMFADEAKGENGEFEFVQVNDLHFTDAKLCPPWFEKAFAAMRESAPNAEFVLMSGDLTTANAPMEFAGLKDLWPQLKIPVHVVLGNHDVTVTGERTRFTEFYPGKLNYFIEHRGWQIFCLDSVETRAAEKTTILKESLAWIEEEVKKHDPKKPTIISTHFPMGIANCRRPKNADAFLAPFKKYNVQHIFNGHWHGYSEMEINGATCTTDRCCSRFRENHDGSPKKGWFVCRAKDGRVSRRFVCVPDELLKSGKSGAA